MMPLELCFAGKNQVEFQERKRVSLRSDEIRVRTIMTGIRHGEDLRVLRRKDWNGVFVPRTWGVGEVIETGADVRGFAEGDSVHGPMVHGEENVLREDQAYALHWLRPEFSVFMEPGELGLNCVHASGMKYGDRVAIFGLGAPGLMALQYARASGARELLAVDPLPTRCDVAQRLGVHYPARCEGGKDTCDAVIELSGHAEGLIDAAGCLARGGTLVAGGGPYPLDAINQAESIAQNKASRFVLLHSETMRESHLGPLVYTSIAEKTVIVWPIHSHTIPFQDAAFAYHKIESNPDEYRKVLLEY